MPPKNVNLFFSFSSTNTCFKFWNDVRTIPGKANACAYEGLFKKLTPYIITWLAGFGTPDPIQDKKNPSQTNSAGCRNTTDIICGTLRQQKNASERQTEQ